MKDRYALMIEAARSAGATLLRYFHQGVDVRLKGDVNLVTEADEQAEAELVATIRAAYPRDSVLAEEGRSFQGVSGYQWIIDPLDGTTNFAHGIPHYGVSIGLTDDRGLLAGAVFEPNRKELFHAGRGQGAYLNGTRLRLRAARPLSSCLCVSGFPYDRRERLPELLARVSRALKATRGLRRLGAASLDLAYVAANRLDIYWEDGLQPWDIAAGALIVAEAGGVTTGFDGAALDLDRGDVVACHPHLIDQVIGDIIGAGS